MPTLTLSIVDSHSCDFAYDYLFRERPGVADDEPVPLSVWWGLSPQDVRVWWRSLDAAEPRDLAQRLGIRAAVSAVRRALHLLREEEREAGGAMVGEVKAWTRGIEISEIRMIEMVSAAEHMAEDAYSAAGARVGHLAYVPASVALRNLVQAMAAADGRGPDRGGHMLADVAYLVAKARGTDACARMMAASVIAQQEAMDHYRRAVEDERQRQRLDLLSVLREASR